MRMAFWMVIRYLRDGKKYLSLTFVLSVLGVALAIAALVISMALVSGYETTLRETVIDIHGHVMVLKRGAEIEDRTEAEKTIQKITPELEAITPFALVEGILAHKGQIAGVLVEGVHTETAPQVMNLGRVVTSGEFRLGEEEGLPLALIGKGISRRFSLQVGDTFRVAVPTSGSQMGEQAFQTKVQKFKIVGIMDLGRQDYDERYIVTNLSAAQNFADLGERISGWRLKLNSYLAAEAVASRVNSELGAPYFARYWRDANPNLFEAIRVEKPVIFIIVSLMLVAAAFNISSTLYVSVVRRYQEISILKAIGAKSSFVRGIFTAQGLMVGFLGSIFGIALGIVLCRIFIWAEQKWQLMPGEVYKLTFVRLELRPLDLIVIVGVCTLVCFLATLAPSRRGANLQPVEGLRYE